MKNSVETELKNHISDYLIENNLLDENIKCTNELHHNIFNTDYYIIGYFNCSEWLKKHKIDPFEAVDYVHEYEREIYGEVHTKEINSEKIVNMLVYIVGEKLLFEQYQ